jgi:hypothetical protein
MLIFKHTNSGDNMSGQTSDYKNINFSGILSHDVSFIEEIFKKDSVLRIKRIEQEGEESLKCALIYMDGMVDSLQLNEAVIKPLLVMPPKTEPIKSAEYIATRYLFARDTKITLDFGTAIEGMLYGEAILLIDGIAEAIESDCDARDVAVGDGIDVLALDVVGLHVETAVKMVGTGLTKITRQCDVVIHWRGKDAQKYAQNDA